MKLLKENKEDLPISILTDFISRGWSEVGSIKEIVSTIKQAFKNTKKVEDVLQDLVDAYLICIGQLELYLEKKDYIDASVISNNQVDDDNKLTEDLLVVALNAEDADAEPDYVHNAVKNKEEKEVDSIFSANELGTVKACENSTDALSDESSEFNFIVDFEEPDLTTAKLTDADIYPDYTI